ncbi:EAL domain-containing protein [Shewanella fidelis]|uniref:EAL domain-containing protein n=1 Tax=Shewanella fidelis TaxID=173509 RepID=A0AAW8NKA8_9GAMM|nr:EAL domain-containing protein [Shewanella fidelis]MDR8523703.1 EAL domain-containing protein [Shewanella fidelis]MDW4810250.1 EAL domain-containing protein [Shewanella fidelis]MDW4814395.1 EAL domain-containing protein [Shewanella fidelis]MDW4818486.1 EAL domain-containing protein [Shewanella fidelis]MDW4823862.1 EAL domain-containing protein [Shewanella fidelis]
MKILIIDECSFRKGTVRKIFSDAMCSLPINFQHSGCSKSAINTLDKARRSRLTKINLIIIELNLVIEHNLALINYMVKVKDSSTPIIIIGNADGWVLKLVSNIVSSFKLNLLGSLNIPLRSADVYTIIQKIKQIYGKGNTEHMSVAAHDTVGVIGKLNEEKLSLYYQPKIDIITNKIIGFEALSRIYIDKKNIITPDCFLPILESNHFNFNLTKLVFENALDYWGSHKALKKYQLSVNINIDDLLSEQLVSEIISQYKEYEDIGLTLELTEYSPIKDEVITFKSIKRIITNGIKVSLDDFGKSYSSFDRLDSIPFDEIKIDKSFISDLDTNSRHQAIVEAVIELASKLKVKVTAEGVETHSVLKMLEQMNCCYAQGYYFSKPVAATELVDWIANYNRQLEHI